MMGARKESTPDLCISARQNSVTEPCATLSDASLLQHSVSGFSGVSSGLPDLSSLSSQQCQGHNRTTAFDGRPSGKIQAPEADDQQNGRTSQSLRVQYDKNRSAQPSAESDMPGMLGEEDADTGVDNEDVESVGETDLDNLLKGETDLDYPGPPPDTTAPGHIRLIGSSVDESKPVDRPRESERRSILEKKKETTLYSVIVYIIYRFFDTLLSVWSLKSEITKLFIILICVSVSIFCCYWVCVNGVYYSFHQGLEWFLVLMTVLILEVTVFEPAAFMACALMGMQIWKKPLIINECLKRFKIVMDDLFFRDWMTYIEVANRQITSPVHQQAAPESASLFHLHDKIYAALKKHVIAPDVVFHTGVYWLIIYTACTIVLVNIQTDITNANMQATHIAQALGLEDAEYEKPIDVDGMWDYINNKLRTGLIYMEAHLNESVLPWRQLNASRTSLGSMLITPVRLKQIRVQPYRLLLCSPLYKTVEIDLMRQCNFELNKDNIDTSDYGFSWTDYEQTGFDNRYSNRPDGSNIFATIDLVPPYGYTSVVYFDQITTLFSLQEIQDSDWIDEHTRILVVDFSLVNVYSHIVSSYRILFDFKRSSPFWSAISFHFRFEDPSNMKYFMIFWGIIFLNISAYNIIKEMMLVHKMGILNYLSELASYTEILKVLLSLVLCYVYFRKIDLRGEILNDLEDSYRFREKNKFVDFFEMAMLDYVYAITGGFLAFVCIFQIFVMLSKIRRLLVFLRLLISCVTLFYMPLATATAFAFLSHMLFGKTNENFSSLPISYLMINQYFIKPRAIYEALTDNHPYIGPFFYFLLGFCINFFMVNFFIVFLNEAYSSIQNQVRIESYKVREKTRLEYVYEFLGISSTITWDIADDEMLKERARDRDYLKDIKSLKAL